MHMRLMTKLMVMLLSLGILATANLASAADPDVTQDKIIISGAAGKLGKLTIQKLLARGVPARNLILVSRTPDELDQYVKLGAVSRFGDFYKPESLAKAFAGGTRMLLISIGGGPMPRPQAHKNAIDAAKAAGVKQIAYTSWVGLSNNDFTGIGADHHQTELLLQNSGVAWTSLRNSVYMDNLLVQGAKMVAAGSTVVPVNETRYANVTREDCAEAAAAVLTTAGHDNKAYDITGTELLGVRDVAAMASEVTGRKIAVSAATGAANGPTLAGASASVVSQDFAKLTGHPATSLKAFFEANKTVLTGGK